jgi:hypothetical protein
VLSCQALWTLLEVHEPISCAPAMFYMHTWAGKVNPTNYNVDDKSSDTLLASNSCHKDWWQTPNCL